MKLTLLITFLSLLSISDGQSCAAYTFSDNTTFNTCVDLPELSSSLHWTYTASSATVKLAYRRAHIVASGRWVSWAINPVSGGMVGAQCLVATYSSAGDVIAYTSPVMSYDTWLAKGQLSFEVAGLRAVYADMEVILFATLAVLENRTRVNHVWQDGALSASGVPLSHVTSGPNMRSCGTLDFLAGAQTPQGDREEESHDKGMHDNDNNTGFKLIVSHLFCLFATLCTTFFIFF